MNVEKLMREEENCTTKMGRKNWTDKTAEEGDPWTNGLMEEAPVGYNVVRDLRLPVVNPKCLRIHIMR